MQGECCANEFTDKSSNSGSRIVINVGTENRTNTEHNEKNNEKGD